MSETLARLAPMPPSQRDKSPGTSYDSPPPGGSEFASPTMTRSTRKRTNDNSEEKEQRPAKRPRPTIQYSSKSASAKRVRRTTLPKPSTQTQPPKTRTSSRRRSAPNKTCEYGPVDEETEIEEDGKAKPIVHPQTRPSSVKAALKVVAAAPIPSALRLEQAVNQIFLRAPPNPCPSINNDEDIGSDRLDDQLHQSCPAERENDGGFDEGIEEHTGNEVDDDEHLNDDQEIRSQIAVERPQQNLPSHGNDNSSDATATSASYTIITNNDTKSRKGDGRRAGKSIAIPGRQDTPSVIASRRSSRIRNKDLLDTLMETQEEGSENHGEGSEFQLKRRNNDNEDQDGDEDEDDEGPASNDETPSPPGWSKPSPSGWSKSGDRHSTRHDENALCLPPGYTRTRSPRKNTHRSPLRRISPTEPRILGTEQRSASFTKQTLCIPDSQEATNLRPRQPTTIIDRDTLQSQNSQLIPQVEVTTAVGIEDFHARLLKKGIRCSFAEDGQEEAVEDEYNSDPELAANEDESNPDDEMQEVEPQYPEYQQNIRDALADFAEVCSPKTLLTSSTSSPSLWA